MERNKKDRMKDRRAYIKKTETNKEIQTQIHKDRKQQERHTYTEITKQITHK